MSKNYTISGSEIYSERGRLVAVLDGNGIPVMCPGMAGAHSRGVQEFLAEKAGKAGSAGEAGEAGNTGNTGNTEMAEDRGNTTVYVGTIPAAPAEGELPEEFKKTESMEDWEVSTIPESNLPAFSAEYGVYTPGFLEYVSQHKLTALQVAALIRRLTKR